MGRHEAPSDAPGRRGVIAALVAGTLVIAGAAYAVEQGTGSDDPDPAATRSAVACTTAPLQLEVAPEVAELVTAQLAAATKADPCHRYEVSATRSSTVASRIRQGRAPDVWVADSTVWLDQTEAGSPGSAVTADWASRGSLAASPVVLANPVTSKDKLSGAFASWGDLINRTGAVHLANPHLDTASRLAFLASQGASTAKSITAGQRIILLSRFAASSTDDLLEGAKDPSTSTTTRSEPFPISEHALAAFTASTPDLLEALAPRAGTPWLNYPYIPAPDLTPELQQVAEAGWRALTSTAAVEAFTQAGFRPGPDAPGPSIDGDPAVEVAALAEPPATARLRALRQWDVLKADARMLAIVDVSGSMTTVAKDTGGKTRAKVAEESLITAVQRLPAGSQVGGWIFSTDKDGKGKDWVPIAPIARLDEPVGSGTHREAIVTALRKFPSYISGDTGLYDTTAAAFSEMTRTYDSAYYNSVVIVTDGKNDDPGGGLNLEQLVSHITRLKDPAKPVRVITIGMGEADLKALERISALTGGSSYSANTPDDLLTVFVQALLSREPSQAP